MKKISGIALGLLTGVLVTSFLFSNYVMALQPPHFYLNGKPMKIDVQPYMVNGNMYLPVREFCEALGAEVTWDDKNRSVNIELKDIDTANAGEEINVKLTQAQNAPNLVQAYAMVIDELYNTDIALNDGIRYLAVDLTGITNLTAEEQKNLRYFLLDKYPLATLNKTYDELVQQGYITYIDSEHQLGIFKEGILITINDNPLEDNSVTISCDKYRSAYGTVGFGDLVMRHQNNNWVVAFYNSESSEMVSPTRPLVRSKKAMAEQPLVFYINGKPVKIDVEPYMVNGKMYLPVRAFCKALGGKVTWDDKNRSINIALQSIATYNREEGPDANYIPCKRAYTLVEAYAMVIDELYNIDIDLKHGMKSIAVDTRHMDNLTPEEKAKLLNLICNKYGLPVLNKTNPWDFEDAIQISIDDKAIDKDTLIMNVSIYGSFGTVAYHNLVMKYTDGYWFISLYGQKSMS